MVDVQMLLSDASAKGATSLHLRPGQKPFVRVGGLIEALSDKIIDSIDLDLLAVFLLSEAKLELFRRTGSILIPYRRGSRPYQVQISRLVDGNAFVFRSLAKEIPTMEELGLPEFLEEFLNLRSGLLLFTGPVGSGKTTTMASMLRNVREKRSLHIITVEDPIEYIPEDGPGFVQQFELKSHLNSFADGARIACASGCDILVIGEIQDGKTLEAIRDATESGILVLASMPSGSVSQAIAKLESFFPEQARTRARQLLSDCLRAAICQVLVRSRAGRKLVPAFEILTSTKPVRKLLAQGKYDELRDSMTAGRGVGMTTLDDYLLELIEANLVDPDDAASFAFDKAPFAPHRRRVHVRQ